MAVSVDTVYQRVLGILNKEQRGYVTPQEFNLFANQAQLSIFEQYFYDINQFGRLHGNDTEYSDMLNILEEKIQIFEQTDTLAYGTSSFTLPSGIYRLGSVIYSNITTDAFGVQSTALIEAELINKKDFLYINLSPLTKPTNTRPIYTYRGDEVQVFGDAEIDTNVSCNYISKPASVSWAYQMVFGEALYDATNSVDFPLHPSEETNLVLKILELAGILMNDPGLYQIAASEEEKQTQLEKS